MLVKHNHKIEMDESSIRFGALFPAHDHVLDIVRSFGQAWDMPALRVMLEFIRILRRYFSPITLTLRTRIPIAFFRCGVGDAALDFSASASVQRFKRLRLHEQGKQGVGKLSWPTSVGEARKYQEGIFKPDSYLSVQRSLARRDAVGICMAKGSSYSWMTSFLPFMTRIPFERKRRTSIPIAAMRISMLCPSLSN